MTFCKSQIQTRDRNLPDDTSLMFLEHLDLPLDHPFCKKGCAVSCSDSGPLNISNVFNGISSFAFSLEPGATEIAAFAGLWVRFAAPFVLCLLLIALFILGKVGKEKNYYTLQLSMCFASAILSLLLMFDGSYNLNFGPWFGALFFLLSLAVGQFHKKSYKVATVQVIAVVVFLGYGLIQKPASPTFGYHPKSTEPLNEGLYYDGIKNPFVQALVNNWPIEERQYGISTGATPWTMTGDSRTAMPYLMNPQRRLSWTRVWQEMEDGEVVALDVLFPDTGHNASNHIYLLLAGITGGSKSGYIQDFATRRTDAGDTVVAMVNRGLMDLPILGGNGYHVARTSDIQEVAERLQQTMKKRGGSKSLLVGVGFSVGGNTLGNYVARAGHRVALDTAIVISGSLDKRIATDNPRSAKLWHAAYAPEYRHFLLDGKLGSQNLEERLSRDRIKSIFTATSTNEMAEIVADYYGFDDVNHYHAESCVLGDVTEDDYLHGYLPDSARIHNISIPMLVVHALDDPVLPAESVVASEGIMHPDNLVKTGKGNLMILLTKQGGHVGWPMGSNPSDNQWKWTSNVASSFVKALLRASQDQYASQNRTLSRESRTSTDWNKSRWVEAPISAVVLLIPLAFLLAIFQIYWNWRNNPFRLENPGPSKKASFLFGNIRELFSFEKPTDAALKWLMEAKNNAPGNNTIPFLVFSEVLGETNTIIVDPDIVKQVLTSPVANDSSLYKKNWTFTGKFLGEGLLTLEGTQWHRHRRILNPCFGPKLIKEFVNNSVQRLTRELVSIWKTSAVKGKAINVQNHFSALVIDAIGEFGFSGAMGALNSLSSEYQDHLPPVADAILQFTDTRPSVVSLLLNLMNLGSLEFLLRPNFAKSRAILKLAIEKEISTVRTSIKNGFTASDSKSMLPVMLQAKDTSYTETSKSKYLNNKELRDEVQTFIAAGFETTRTLLTWSIVELCQNKAMQNRLFKEIFDEFGGDNNLITADAVDSLPYLASFIKEVLRLYPSASFYTRVATKAIQWHGQTIPAGTRAYISLDVLHRNPDHWIKPDEFRPERWLNGETDNLHKFSYLPFGAGGRSCIGQRLALLEVKIVLATLVQTFEMDLAPRHKGVEVKAVGVFPAPKEGLDICVKLRCHAETLHSPFQKKSCCHGTQAS